MAFCEVCRRGRVGVPTSEDAHAPCRARVAGGCVYVVHEGYGCDTGCCGHRLYVEEARGNSVWSEFEFVHDVEFCRNWAGETAQQLGIRVAYDRMDLKEECY